MLRMQQEEKMSPQSYKEKVKEVDRWVTLSQRPSGSKEYHPG